MSALDRYRGCMLGLAIGDAYGAAYEFTHPSAINMIDDYQYCEVHDIEAGYYTDDASQTLCLALSILENGTFNKDDFMGRLVRWYRDGYMSSVDGVCFDIGCQTRLAIEYYESFGEYLDTNHHTMQGNGSLMRIGAIAMAYYGDDLIRYASESSVVTHAHQQCVDLCVQFATIVRLVLNGASKEYIRMYSGFNLEIHHLNGSGYVLNAYQIALYSFLNTESYFDSIQLAVSIGQDTDTNACITGMLTGAFYGIDEIDQHLIDGLLHHEMFMDVADRLYKFSE